MKLRIFLLATLVILITVCVYAAYVTQENKSLKTKLIHLQSSYDSTKTLVDRLNADHEQTLREAIVAHKIAEDQYQRALYDALRKESK